MNEIFVLNWSQKLDLEVRFKRLFAVLFGKIDIHTLEKCRVYLLELGLSNAILLTTTINKKRVEIQVQANTMSKKDYEKAMAFLKVSGF